MYKVLVVDDERMIRQGIQKAIPWSSLQVEKVFTAGSAAEALEIVKKHSIDLLITDISMSEMTGLDLIERIRESDEDMRVVVLTGYDRFDYARKALKLRAHDFLLKPVDEEELRKSIEKQLRILKEQRASGGGSRTEGVRQQYHLDRLMEEFFSGSVSDREAAGALLDRMGIDAEQEMQAGIVIPDMVPGEDEESRTFRVRSIQNICMEMLDQRGLGITVRDRGGQIHLVFFRGGERNEGEETAREMAELLKSEYEIRVRVVIGSAVKGVDRLHISANDAVHLLKNERKPFQDMVIQSKSERKRADIFQDVFREFKSAMIASVGDMDQTLHIFERFKVAVESYNLSARYTEMCCFELASALAFSYLNDGGNPSEENLNALMKSLSGTTREGACEVTEAFFQRILSQKNGSDHELVRKVKYRIHEGLGEELTVAGIAAELYVTPNYLSRLFKRITGEGCNEYIVRKRIEKAKALLEATNLKVGEIAAMVGYGDINYFSLVFKKHTGMSPTKYRSLRE